MIRTIYLKTEEKLINENNIVVNFSYNDMIPYLKAIPYLCNLDFIIIITFLRRGRGKIIIKTFSPQLISLRF